MNKYKGTFVGWYEEQDLVECIPVYTIKLKDCRITTCARIVDFTRRGKTTHYRIVASYGLRQILIETDGNNKLINGYFESNKDLGKVKKQIENNLKKLGYKILDKDTLCFE